jgi:hypothetical protein
LELYSRRAGPPTPVEVIDLSIDLSSIRDLDIRMLERLCVGSYFRFAVLFC